MYSPLLILTTLLILITAQETHVYAKSLTLTEKCVLAFNTACTMNPAEAFCRCEADPTNIIKCNIKSGSTLSYSPFYDVVCKPYYNESVTGIVDVCNPDINNCASFDYSKTRDSAFSYGTLRNCTEGYYCKESTDPPFLCGARNQVNGSSEFGFHCKLPTTSTPCAEDSFCPMGSWEDNSCGTLTSCTLGSIRRIQLLPLLVTLLVIVLTSVAYLVLKHYERILIDLYVKETMFMKGFGEETPLVLKPIKESLTVTFENICYDIPDARKNWPWAKSTSGRKSVLSGVSGCFKAGKVTAVMGPSGGGKTSLINVLTGKASRTSGKIFVNDEECELSSFRKHIGFVPQEDIMLTDLTVEDILKLSAFIRLPKSWTKTEKLSQFSATIRILELENVQKSPVGDCDIRGISGGQKKRVSVGIELVANPSLIIMDEPTSGLDATSANEVIKALKDIASHDRTIIAIVHQPKYESFIMFDHLLLLGKDGRVVYQGSAIHLKEYLDSQGFKCPPLSNPADYALDVISCKEKDADGKYPERSYFGDIWEKYCTNNGTTIFKSTLPEKDEQMKEDGKPIESIDKVDVPESNENGQVGDEGPSFRPIDIEEVPSEEKADIETPEKFPYFRQFFYFGSRALIQRYRKPSQTLIFMAVHGAIAIILGFSFSQGEYLYLPPMKDFIGQFCPAYIEDKCFERPLFAEGLLNFAFFLPLTVGVAATITSVHTFADELPVYWREAGSGISRLMYFLGKCVADLPFVFLGSLIFTSLLVVTAKPIMDFDILLGILFSLQSLRLTASGTLFL